MFPYFNITIEKKFQYEFHLCCVKKKNTSALIKFEIGSFFLPSFEKYSRLSFENSVQPDSDLKGPKRNPKPKHLNQPDTNPIHI